MGVFGREKELATLAAGLDDAAAGRGRFFLVIGEAGIGKTALVREMERAATDRRFRVLFARGWDGEGAPAYWPFIQIFRLLDRHHELTPSDDPRQRFAMFDAAAGWLRDAAKTEPLIVVLDDLHAADPSSLSMLNFLARELRSARIAIVGCHRERDGARGPDVDAELVRLAREATVVRLERLERDAVSALLADAKGTMPSPIVDLIFKTSEGVPLFVEEILRAMTMPGAAWVTSAPLPAGVRGAVRERLGRLDAATRRVLETASVIGKTFTVALVDRVLATSADKKDDVIHDLVEKAATVDVLERLGPGRYAFAHAMLREALYRDIPGGPRAKLHAAVLEALEANGDATIGERAHHALRAAPVIGAERAVDLATKAAEAALSVQAPEDAAEILRRAMAVLDLAPSDPKLRAKVVDALARTRAGAPVTPAAVKDDAMPVSSKGGLTLTREGELWCARRGDSLVRLKDSRGLHMLARLVEQPGQEVHCIALSTSPTEDGAPIPAGDSGDVLDREAIAAYRERLVEVEEELREAEGWNDIARVEASRSEAEFLRAELGRAVGLGGRSRKSGADTERARVNCQRRIRDAVKRIGEQDVAMGKHLLLSVKTGTFCSYQPD